MFIGTYRQSYNVPYPRIKIMLVYLGYTDLVTPEEVQSVEPLLGAALYEQRRQEMDHRNQRHHMGRDLGAETVQVISVKLSYVKDV